MSVFAVPTGPSSPSARVSLPTRQRDVLVLRYLADLTEADTAAALGVAIGTVKQHAHRGLAALRASLAPAGEPAPPQPLSALEGTP